MNENNKKIKMLFKNNKDFILKIETICKLKNCLYYYEICPLYNDYSYHKNKQFFNINEKLIGFNNFNEFYKSTIKNKYFFSFFIISTIFIMNKNFVSIEYEYLSIQNLLNKYHIKYIIADYDEDDDCYNLLINIHDFIRMFKKIIKCLLEDKKSNED